MSNRTVWKYVLHGVVTFQNIPLCGAIVRHVGQDPATSNPAVWIEIDSESQASEIAFTWVGTGKPIPDNVHYVGSVSIGSYVWHIYSNIKLERE